MNDQVVTGVAVVMAVLAVGVNIYFRFVRGWAMGFGPMLLIGFGTPFLLGLTGILIGNRATTHKNLLVGLNLLAIILAITIGYII